MYAHRKPSFEEMKEPGDWTTTVYQPEEGGPKVPYGINMICRCGELIALRHAVHAITFENDVLDISPSIGHYDNSNRGQFKCHYFIKQGEYVQA